VLNRYEWRLTLSRSVGHDWGCGGLWLGNGCGSRGVCWTAGTPLAATNPNPIALKPGRVTWAGLDVAVSVVWRADIVFRGRDNGLHCGSPWDLDTALPRVSCSQGLKVQFLCTPVLADDHQVICIQQRKITTDDVSCISGRVRRANNRASALCLRSLSSAYAHEKPELRSV
jgi:hypothetical protein